jgi:hypothetical protein
MDSLSLYEPERKSPHNSQGACVLWFRSVNRRRSELVTAIPDQSLNTCSRLPSRPCRPVPFFSRFKNRSIAFAFWHQQLIEDTRVPLPCTQVLFSSSRNSKTF